MMTFDYDFKVIYPSISSNNSISHTRVGFSIEIIFNREIFPSFATSFSMNYLLHTRHLIRIYLGDGVTRAVELCRSPPTGSSRFPSPDSWTRMSEVADNRPRSNRIEAGLTAVRLDGLPQTGSVPIRIIQVRRAAADISYCNSNGLISLAMFLQ